MRKEIWFRGARRHYLRGDLFLPSGETACPAVVFAHGLGSSRKSPRNLAVAQGLLDEGIASLLFDFAGHGESQGSLDDATITKMIEDIGTAIDRALVEARIDAHRIGVAGSGAGGAVAVLQAAIDKRIKALVLCNAEVGSIDVLEAADYVDAPTLLLVGETDPATVHENHALQSSLVGECRLVIVEGADTLFDEPAHLRKVVEFSVGWFSRKLAVPTVA